MSNPMRRIGCVATMAITLILVANILYEPSRQRQAQADYEALALAYGIDIYAYHCVTCHGAAGEGLGAYPALNQDFVRNRNLSSLFSTIAYGRYGTDMIAYASDYGGPLTTPQIDYMVNLLQHDAWDTVAVRVAALGLTPEEITLTTAQNSTPSAQAIDYIQAIELFQTHCAECHGENGEGTLDAPQLYNPYVQSMSSDRLHDIVISGVRNTNMAGFETVLPADEIDTLVLLLQNWYHPPQTESTQPVSLEEGQFGFETWCAPCHGVRGEGGSIAPSLNDLPAVPADFIMSRVRSGSNAMPPFAESDLPDTQLASIIAYAQHEIIGSGLPQISAEMLVDGQSLYIQQCAQCHGEHGEGTTDDGHALVTVPPLRGRTIINFVRLGSSQTPGIPPEMVSDAALERIIAYIHSLSQ